jgi:hypothetical protein
MILLRGALAVLAGIGVFALALVAANAGGKLLLGTEADWFNRSTSTQIVWLCTNAVCMIAGGYVAAWLAPRARVAHAVIVSAIQAGLTLAAFLTLNDKTTPTWLWIAGIAVTVPAAWLGGRLRDGRRRQR